MWCVNSVNVRAGCSFRMPSVFALPLSHLRSDAFSSPRLSTRTVLPSRDSLGFFKGARPRLGWQTCIALPDLSPHLISHAKARPLVSKTRSSSVVRAAVVCIRCYASTSMYPLTSTPSNGGGPKNCQEVECKNHYAVIICYHHSSRCHPPPGD